jgi:hypothetical protein
MHGYAWNIRVGNQILTVSTLAGSQRFDNAYCDGTGVVPDRLLIVIG